MLNTVRKTAVIGGQTVSSDDWIVDLDPSTGAVLAEVARCGESEISAAVDAAREAFPHWRANSPRDRAPILRRIADAILNRRDSLARDESYDTGKPLRQADSDVVNAARHFEYYGSLCEGFYGDVIPLAEDVLAYSCREPYGVTGQIIPWNYPLQTAARTVAPALAAGNCCILKPAEEAPLTPMRLAELAQEAGLAQGVLNVVPGYGEEAGAALATHPGVNHLSFTGSREVGRIVAAAAGENTIPVTLELGGKSPNIVFEDAHLDGALPVIANSILQHAGQTCSAGSRLLVERSAHARLVDALCEFFEGVRLGPGIEDPDLGPLISESQRERVARYVELGKSEAKLLIGGEPPKDGRLAGGYFFLPTLFDEVAPNAVIAREEIFGPVLAVTAFDDVDEAAYLANETEYGLVAAVWTRDVDKAHRLAREIDAGQVFINTFGAGGGQELPFGGYKGSGYGRLKGIEALRLYTQVKTVVVKISG